MVFRSVNTSVNKWQRIFNSIIAKFHRYEKDAIKKSWDVRMFYNKLEQKTIKSSLV